MTNLAEITHDPWKTFILGVGLGRGYTRSGCFVANLVAAILVSCGPRTTVNTRHCEGAGINIMKEKQWPREARGRVRMRMRSGFGWCK